MNLSVGNTQLVGYTLFNLSGLVGIILTLLGLMGVLTVDDIPQWIGVFNESFFAVCYLVSYLMLSKIAANLPTRNVMKYVGVFLFVVAIFSVVFRCYHNNHELSPMELSVFNALFFALKVSPLLYLFGVIVRNNSTCRKAILSINVIYAVSFVCVYLFSAIVLPIFQFKAGPALLDILQGLVWIVYSYVLFTSEVFGGQMNTEPAPKGAYRFWNKYFTWYIITMLGSAILMVAFIP